MFNHITFTTNPAIIALYFLFIVAIIILTHRSGWKRGFKVGLVKATVTLHETLTVGGIPVSDDMAHAMRRHADKCRNPECAVDKAAQEFAQIRAANPDSELLISPKGNIIVKGAKSSAPEASSRTGMYL